MKNTAVVPRPIAKECLLREIPAINPAIIVIRAGLETFSCPTLTSLILILTKIKI